MPKISNDPLMRQIEYLSGSGGTSVTLSAVELAANQTAPLVSRRITYDDGEQGITSLRFAQFDVSVDITSIDSNLWNDSCDTFEADCIAGTPGTMSCDGWSALCYCVAEDVDEVWQDHVTGRLTFVLVDGFWYREKTKQFFKKKSEETATYLDYPFDYEFDYLTLSSQTSFVSDSLVPKPVRFVIYGPADNPRITIGANTYQWNVSVPTGSRLISDGTEDRKSIVLVSQDGIVSDMFECGMRGAGLGSGSYCFEPIQPGTSKVSWNGGFGFDVITQDRKGGLPWTS